MIGLIGKGNTARMETKNRNMVVFYFPEDAECARMGISEAYLIGIDDFGEVWMSSVKELPRQSYEFDPTNIPVSRSGWSGESYQIQRLLDGKKPGEIKHGAFVDAGMGNWGVCMGSHKMPLTELTHAERENK